MVGATGFTHLKIGINNRQLGIKRYHPFLKVNLTHTKKKSRKLSKETAYYQERKYREV